MFGLACLGMIADIIGTSDIAVDEVKTSFHNHLLSFGNPVASSLARLSLENKTSKSKFKIVNFDEINDLLVGL